jgi:hypothetical protein
VPRIMPEAVRTLTREPSRGRSSRVVTVGWASVTVVGIMVGLLLREDS